MDFKTACSLLGLTDVDLTPDVVLRAYHRTLRAQAHGLNAIAVQRLRDAYELLRSAELVWAAADARSVCDGCHDDPHAPDCEYLDPLTPILDLFITGRIVRARAAVEAFEVTLDHGTFNPHRYAYVRELAEMSVKLPALVTIELARALAAGNLTLARAPLREYARAHPREAAIAKRLVIRWEPPLFAEAFASDEPSFWERNAERHHAWLEILLAVLATLVIVLR